MKFSFGRLKSLTGLTCLTFLLLVGCSKPADKGPEAVFVDTAQLSDLLASPVPLPTNRLVTNLTGATSSIPALPARDLFIGDSARIVREAEDLIETEQTLALAQAKKRLQSSLLAKAEKLHLAGKPLLDREISMLADEELASIQAELATHSTKRQPLVFELGQRRGHPDLSRASRKFGAIRKETFFNEEPRVEELRRLLNLEDDSFLRTKEAIRSKIRAQMEEAKGSYAARLERMKAQAFLDADRQAKELVSQSGARIDPKSLLVLNANLPARSAASLSLPPVSVRLTPLANPKRLLPTTELLKQMIPIWAKTRNYRIVATRAEGRDGTTELKQWLKSYSIGR